MISLRTKGSDQRPCKQSFICNVTGEIWIQTDRLNPDQSPDSSDSDDDSLVSMYQQGGHCLVDVGQQTWETDLAMGIETAGMTPLLNGVTCISLDASSKAEDTMSLVRDDGGVICTRLLLRLLVDEYVAWRLAIIKKWGEKGSMHMEVVCFMQHQGNPTEWINRTSVGRYQRRYNVLAQRGNSRRTHSGGWSWWQGPRARLLAKEQARCLRKWGW